MWYRIPPLLLFGKCPLLNVYSSTVLTRSCVVLSSESGMIHDPKSWEDNPDIRTASCCCATWRGSRAGSIRRTIWDKNCICILDAFFSVRCFFAALKVNFHNIFTTAPKSKPVLESYFFTSSSLNGIDAIKDYFWHPYPRNNSWLGYVCRHKFLNASH